MFKSLHAGSRTTVERYPRTDDPSRRTILAEIVFEADGTPTLAKPLVGVAHFWRVGPDTANMTVVVGDEWQRRGIGKALLMEISDKARAVGVRRFNAFSGWTMFRYRRCYIIAGSKCGNCRRSKGLGRF